MSIVREWCESMRQGGRNITYWSDSYTALPVVNFTAEWIAFTADDLSHVGTPELLPSFNRLSLLLLSWIRRWWSCGAHRCGCRAPILAAYWNVGSRTIARRIYSLPSNGNHYILFRKIYFLFKNWVYRWKVEINTPLSLYEFQISISLIMNL